MTTIIERFRGLPRRLQVVGGTAILTSAAVALIALGGSGSAQRVDSDAAASSASDTLTEVASTSGDTTTITSSTDAPATTAGPSTPTATATTLGSEPVGTIDLDDDYRLEINKDVPAVEGRTIPVEPPPGEPPPVTVTPPAWAASTRVTEAGQVATDVGCADDLSAASLDVFLSKRVGPVLGWDYQHVYPLGDDRYLWLFQDAFVDHSGTKTTLGTSRFVHNAAMVQDGPCFTLLHRGTAAKPAPFEVGDGSVNVRSKWLWPMGGELVDDRLYVFWAEMVKDPYDPDPPNGLGWHPNQVVLATYDAATMERLSWESPRNPGVAPIYGYAVASDDTHTYFFGNTFEQNMIREGGFWNGPHSATKMYLARVPLAKITEWPEYRTADGWSYAPEDAVPIVERFYAENPMQPRFLDGQWVAATAVDGYWGDSLAIDVADQPWGPWSTVQYGPLAPRNADPKMNTYHAHLLPWRDPFGSVQISVSNNARNMMRDAWPNPHRYRPMVIFAAYAPTPPTTTTTSTTTLATTTTAPSTTAPPTTTTSTTTTAPPTTTTTVPATTTTSPTSTTTATTAAPPRTTTTTLPATTTTTLAPGVGDGNADL